MLEILLIEDNAEKRKEIRKEVVGYFGNENVRVTEVESLSGATKWLYTSKFELIVADLLLPRRKDEEADDVSEELIQIILDSEVNRRATVVAISMFADMVEVRRKQFVEAGIILVHFDMKSNGWRDSLNVCLQRVEQKNHFDFVILCALEKERNAFASADCEVGELAILDGLDCLKMSINDLRGVCVKLPRMGLVDAAVTAARAIEVLQPRIICMSGICAGFSGAVTIGTLLVSDVCWEHQSGKWAGDVFKMEHYQEGLGAELRSAISQFIERGNGFDYLKSNLISDKVVLAAETTIAPTVTGSAVIASGDRADAIQKQHRKVAGLDMEMYGVYRAAAMSGQSLRCFGAKTVVDLADEAKDDTFHIYGAVLSARFVVATIDYLLNGR